MPARSEQNAFDQPLGIHRAIGTQCHEGIGGACLAGRNFGEVAGQYIEPPNLGRPLKQFEPLGQQRLGLVAGFARPLHDLGRNKRASEVRFDRNGQGQGIEEQTDDLTLEPSRNIGDCS
ncbi:MAG TPA: hypothetical protein VK148_04175 [Xanthobacteraceae bacterium]|nr:hypothetical protein [Xanthobacteraceae bacterium]